MRIGVIGTGYVGLVTGVALSDFGLNVICMDIDKKRINDLNNGIIPIYEPGLKDLYDKNVYYKRLSFTDNIQKVIEESDVIYIAVGTPSKKDGSSEMKYFVNVTNDIGKYINGYKVIVDKSTVPIGTAREVKKIISNKIKIRDVNYNFDVVSNPEFLREGKAIYDFTHPNRIVLGVESEKSANIMKEVYRVLYLNKIPFVFTNFETAEMIKYASNAFLAVKIGFINELSLLCEKVGADIIKVAIAMGMDGRISPKFLHAGPGYGGSCFPKDTKAIVDIGRKYNENLSIVQATIDSNENHKNRMVQKIIKTMGSVEGKTIAILGLTFKPETDDIREAPSLKIIPKLIENGARIKAFCPEGIKGVKQELSKYKESITYCSDEYQAAKDSHAIVILIEWNQFRGMDMQRINKISRDNYLFDFRNLYYRDNNVDKYFKYYGLGL